MKHLLSSLVIFAFPTIFFFSLAAQPSNNIKDLDSLIQRIHKVETGGRTGAIPGDYDKQTKTYKALGPLQIHRVYWLDAVTFDKTIGGKYEDCAGLEYSKLIVKAYFRRYGQKFINRKDWESLARLHNSGPRWEKKIAKSNSYIVRLRKASLHEINTTNKGIPSHH